MRDGFPYCGRVTQNTTPSAANASDSEEAAEPLPWEDHERRTLLCHRCHLPRVFRRRKTRHSLHFILALGTIGLWLPVWGVAILMQILRPWTCTACGSHQRDS